MYLLVRVLFVIIDERRFGDRCAPLFVHAPARLTK